MSTPESPSGATRPFPDAVAVASALAAAIAEADGIDVASAWLFGSTARGRAHRESDVDVAVLLCWGSHRSRSERFEAGILLAGRLQARLGRSVDLLVLNDAPPLLGRAVVTGGVRLLLRDPALDHAYVRDVQLRAADLEPWLRRLRARKLEALRG